MALSKDKALEAVAEGIVFTVRGGATPREAVTQSLAQLDKVIGVVLNRADARDFPAYYRGAYPAQDPSIQAPGA